MQVGRQGYIQSPSQHLCPVGMHGGWMCFARLTARRPTCRAAPTCWCTRWAGVG